ncbi:MAG: SDR family NAD(P)-dependent oxidoreductase, partial [Rhodospirillaceae bacterium]|nr:SDR family NAD(P)-dependent oxidoreductase [Rhodospirillaceae bacterium]
MELDIKGKRALITGASKGIGRAAAEALAEEGCDLDLAARTEGPLTELVEALRASAQVSVRAHVADLSRAGDQARLIEACGDYDILINNAGSNPAGEIDEVDDET